MSKWRPEGWPEPRCVDCPDKVEDQYGLLCNLSCGVESLDKMYEAGADAMLEALRKEGYGRMVTKTIPPYPQRDFADGAFIPGCDHESYVTYFEKLEGK